MCLVLRVDSFRFIMLSAAEESQSACPPLARESKSTVSSGIEGSGGEGRARALNRRRQAGATTGNPKIDF